MRALGLWILAFAAVWSVSSADEKKDAVKDDSKPASDKAGKEKAGEGDEDDASRRAVEHDKFGFPVTFNTEIITKKDALREYSISEGSVGDLGAVRDQVLRRKLLERVSEESGVTVGDEEIQKAITGELERRGGYAEFTTWLDQQGLTLPQYEDYLRYQLLKQRVRLHYIHFGMTQDRKVLPYQVEALPREVRRAFQRDRERWRGRVRARALELVIDLTEKERMDLFDEVPEESMDDPIVWVNNERRVRCEKKCAAVRAELKKGVSFEVLARTYKADVDAQKKRWIEVEDLPEGSESRKFLQGGKAGDLSPPLLQAEGGIKMLQILEIKKTRPASVHDPEVHAYYAGDRTRPGVIRLLRERKIWVLLQLKALDGSTVEPRRVRRELRKGLIAELESSEKQLRRLGLH